MADKIRLGLIGASVKGTWSSRSHLPALKASGDIELTAVCTTRAASAEAARALRTRPSSQTRPASSAARMSPSGFGNEPSVGRHSAS